MGIKKTNEPFVAIEKELKWLADAIAARFRLYFGGEDDTEDLKHISPPDIIGECFFSTRLRQWNLSFEERLMLALVLAAWIKPDLLDIFLTKNGTIDQVYTDFGGITAKGNHRGFLPTGATVLFLLAGADVEMRLSLESLLFHRSVLVDQKIIALQPAEPGEPILSGLLTLSPGFYRQITGYPDNLPDNYSHFPARQITTPLVWSDLVLEDHVLEEVQAIKAWIEHGASVMKSDSIAKKLKPGYRSLFYGPPGTGKTLTACLLGKYTQHAVYRIDLSALVSKYIGETEKNLAAVFDMAQEQQWILFFDEADSLFGKRTQSNSANDRFANQETSYLLQRIEDYPGVIILATNLKSNMDEAFNRRFQSVIHFALPGYPQRLKLWTEIFANPEFPVEKDVVFTDIARTHNLAGGAIINILRFCILTCLQEGRNTITMDYITRAIKKELRKEGKTL